MVLISLFHAHSFSLTQIFSYMAARHWNRGIIFLFNDVIRDEVLLQVPNGLRCHLVDICMDELAKVNAKAPMPLTEATILDCLDPYFCLAQNSDDNMVHERVMDGIFAKFLDEYSVVSEKEENNLEMDQVHVGTIAEFIFKLGSDVDTQERYRKPLYDMYKTYMKRLKKVGKDVELEVGSSDDIEENMKEDVEDEAEVEMEEAKPKKRKRKAAKGADEERDDGTKETSGPVETKQASKKKRKKDKHSVEARDDHVFGQPPSVKEAGDAEPSPEKKKAKKKKKKSKSSIDSDEGSLGSKGDKKEEVITISYSEQKKAAEDIAKQDAVRSSSKKNKKSAKTPDKTLETPELTSEEKRVKFGRINHSKSYKASMKALKTVKHTPNKTPEHGILKTKLSSPAPTGDSRKGSSKKKARRNKATDYF